ncbi:MAG: urate oxidase / 2-oxo-4-hydroxy-4-carboxy-5-ureidoimidazoline decarboxylase [Gaiellales bacterium]|nr:urate oxidase / 2-oxo-4-hydroxy-4-carboxy-5-ureidoimidazoline decarboxylase [Gaiellales bacterium]
MKGVTITYGKAAVPVYRAYGTPLTGLAPVPESSFSGRENTLMAVEVDVEVFGENFLPAYTEGDNGAVVATDSMKNFILRHGLSYDGATLEGFLAELGHGFLNTYEDMTALRLTGRELRFDPLQGVLYRRSHDDHGVADLHVERERNGAPRLADLRAGRVRLELLKVTGSSFTRFVRDEYTTLPERVDRPLFIHLDVHWRYAEIADASGPDTSRYVASEQVRDVVAAVFSELVSESIQHLVWEMSERLLERFPPLAEVSFSAQNRTREPVAERADDDRVRVSSDPFPAFGTITLTRQRGA